MKPVVSLLGAVAALAVVLQGPAFAQQPAPPKAAPAAKQTTPAAAPKTDAPPSESGALRQRVEQLEEQLVDMQVMVGTLESLARGGGAGARTPAGLPSGGADQARVDALEQQVRALTAQVEQLQQGRGTGSRMASNTAPPPLAPAPGPAVGGGGFATTVTQDPIGQIIGGGNPAATGQPPAAAPSLPQATASDASSKQLYETAYGLLLQQDYGAAETAFEEFLKRFPNDTLAGNAQYWLGETFYVRGQYKPAAAAFLKGYQTYARSSKAPDSLLKLAMSLDRLGQRDAACSSYSELTVRFPNAPGAIRSRAETERRRLGCA